MIPNVVSYDTFRNVAGVAMDYPAEVTLHLSFPALLSRAAGAELVHLSSYFRPLPEPGSAPHSPLTPQKYCDSSGRLIKLYHYRRCRPDQPTPGLSDTRQHKNGAPLSRRGDICGASATLEVMRPRPDPAHRRCRDAAEFCLSQGARKVARMQL